MGSNLPNSKRPDPPFWTALDKAQTELDIARPTMASVARSQPAKVATVEFEVLGMLCGVETVDRAAHKVDWLSVVDVRKNLPMELAQVDFEEPTPPATLYQAVAALKESNGDSVSTFEQAHCTVDCFV